MRMLTGMFMTCGARAHSNQLHAGWGAAYHDRGAGHDHASTLQTTSVAAICSCFLCGVPGDHEV